MKLYDVIKEHQNRLGLTDKQMIEFLCDVISPYGLDAPAGQALVEEFENTDPEDIDFKD